MPPHKDSNHEVVDMTKQYGVQGLKSGTFEYVHHEVPKPAFNLMLLMVNLELAPDIETARKILIGIAAACISIAGLLYWFLHNDTPPIQMHRPAIDATAKILH